MSADNLAISSWANFKLRVWSQKTSRFNIEKWGEYCGEEDRYFASCG